MTNLDLSIKRILSSESSEYTYMESLLSETFPVYEYRDLNELRKLVDFGSKLGSDLGSNLRSNLSTDFGGKLGSNLRKTLAEKPEKVSDSACEFSSNLVYLEDVPVGFINFWRISLDSGNKNRDNISEDLKNNLSAVTYIEHFAIDPSFRNGQLGSSVLNYFLTTYCPNIKSKSREEYPEPKLVVLEVERPINPSSDELSARRIRFYERLGFSLLNFDYHQPPYHSGNEFIPMHLMSFGTPPNNATFSIIKSHIYKYVYGLTI